MDKAIDASAESTRAYEQIRVRDKLGNDPNREIRRRAKEMCRTAYVCTHTEEETKKKKKRECVFVTEDSLRPMA